MNNTTENNLSQEHSKYDDTTGLSFNRGNSLVYGLQLVSWCWREWSILSCKVSGLAQFGLVPERGNLLAYLLTGRSVAFMVKNNSSGSLAGELKLSIDWIQPWYIIFTKLLYSSLYSRGKTPIGNRERRFSFCWALSSSDTSSISSAWLLHGWNSMRSP